jgi:hypothetical protein
MHHAIWTKRLKNMNKSTPTQTPPFSDGRHFFDSIFSQLATPIPQTGLSHTPGRTVSWLFSYTNFLFFPAVESAFSSYY